MWGLGSLGDRHRSAFVHTCTCRTCIPERRLLHGSVPVSSDCPLVSRCPLTQFHSGFDRDCSMSQTHFRHSNCAFSKRRCDIGTFLEQKEKCPFDREEGGGRRVRGTWGSDRGEDGRRQGHLRLYREVGRGHCFWIWYVILDSLEER